MSGSVAHRVRLASTCGILKRLDQEIDAWIHLRTGRDSLEQYKTPLETLRRTLVGAVQGLQAEAEQLERQVSPVTPLGDLYARCRTLEEQAALVRKIWSWFRVKFDQRDDKTLELVLAAADEVVWSCYKEAFDSAQLTGARVADRGPAPVPYLDAEQTPEAIIRDDPPRGLAPGETDKLIGPFLARLPVPVVRLPATCVDEPWRLVLLGHEVGHHLQYDLVPEGALVEEFGQTLAAAVTAEPEPCGRAAAGRWYGWSREIFADACGLLAMGTGAITAILELELSTEYELLDGGLGRYPAPAVRLGLMAEVAARLGLDGRSALADLNPDELVAPRADDSQALAERRRVAHDDLAQVAKVAAAVLAAPLAGLGPLPRLFRFKATDYLPNGRVMYLANDIMKGSAHAQHTMRAARDAAGGAAIAWRRAGSITDDTARTASLSLLAASLPSLLKESRKAGSRAAEGARGPQDFAGELTKLVRTAVPGETGG